MRRLALLILILTTAALTIQAEDRWPSTSTGGGDANQVVTTKAGLELAVSGIDWTQHDTYVIGVKGTIPVPSWTTTSVEACGASGTLSLCNNVGGINPTTACDGSCAGYPLVFTQNATNEGRIALIQSVTATSITLDRDMPATIASGDDFEIGNPLVIAPAMPNNELKRLIIRGGTIDAENNVGSLLAGQVAIQLKWDDIEHDSTVTFQDQLWLGRSGGGNVFQLGMFQTGATTGNAGHIQLENVVARGFRGAGGAEPIWGSRTIFADLDDSEGGTNVVGNHWYINNSFFDGVATFADMGNVQRFHVSSSTIICDDANSPGVVQRDIDGSRVLLFGTFVTGCPSFQFLGATAIVPNYFTFIGTWENPASGAAHPTDGYIRWAGGGIVNLDIDVPSLSLTHPSGAAVPPIYIIDSGIADALIVRANIRDYGCQFAQNGAAVTIGIIGGDTSCTTCTELKSTEINLQLGEEFAAECSLPDLFATGVATDVLTANSWGRATLKTTEWNISGTSATSKARD